MSDHLLLARAQAQHRSFIIRAFRRGQDNYSVTSHYCVCTAWVASAFAYHMNGNRALPMKTKLSTHRLIQETLALIGRADQPLKNGMVLSTVKTRDQGAFGINLTMTK